VREDPRLTAVLEGNPSDPMPDHVLHVASVRAGSETGTHVVGFDGAHDRITLEHAARSRTAFALGAVLAGEWLTGRTGWHGFDEVLSDLVESSAGDPKPGPGGATERRRD
jgi:dihydrodipicolinate reductase